MPTDTNLPSESIKQRFEKALHQGKNYLRIVSWLLREAYFTKFWGRPAGIVFFASLRLMCQAGAVTILYFYANALKSGSGLSFLSFNFPARQSALLMWIIIICSFLLLTLASLFQYLSRIVSISLASAYEEDSSRRALHVVSSLPDPRTPQVNELLRKGVCKKIPGDARRTGMTVRTIGYTVPQAITGIVATVSIIIIDPLLTSILGGLMLCIFLGQYPANIRGAKHSAVFEQNLRRISKGTAALIRSFLATPQETTKTAMIDELYAHQGFRTTIQAFGGRLRVIEESTLITQIGSALVVCVAVFIIGSRALRGNSNWGLLLAYIVALRAALSGVVQIGRTLTSVSRFYPQLVRYHYLLSAEKKLETIPPRLTPGERLLLNTDGACGAQVDLEVPQRVALYTEGSIDRRVFHLLDYARVRDPAGMERTLGNRPRLLTNHQECYEAAGQAKNGQLGVVDVLFIETEVLASLPSGLQETLLHENIAVIIYKSLRQAPCFEEPTALFWLDYQIRLTVDLRQQDFASAAKKMEYILIRQKQEKQSEDLDVEEEEDDEF